MQVLVPFTIAILSTAALQLSPSDRAQAEDLARAGRSAAAIVLFERIVEANPADIDAKLWVARLALRLGRTADAESAYRSVLLIHPEDVDARIGLGIVLTRNGSWDEALDVLRATEADAGDNADLFAALARAYRRSGDDHQALHYFQRARALAPDDPDVALGFEMTARTYGHVIALEGFGQAGDPGTDVGSGTIMARVRAAPALHFDLSARVQQGPDYSDTVAGGGVVWRATRATTAALHVKGGGKTALPGLDVSGDVAYYVGLFELGAGVRRLTFDGADLTAFSPVLAVDRERLRLESRYTYSRSAFEASGQSSGDHSVLMRGTWQHWRRTALQAAYAYGIESFENLTANQIGALGVTTLAAGLRIDVPSLTRITTTWEHQWRSDQTKTDRVTVAVVQAFP